MDKEPQEARGLISEGNVEEMFADLAHMLSSPPPKGPGYDPKLVAAGLITAFMLHVSDHVPRDQGIHVVTEIAKNMARDIAAIYEAKERAEQVNVAYEGSA